MLSKIRQKEKNKNHMVSLICAITDTENPLMLTRAEGGFGGRGKMGRGVICSVMDVNWTFGGDHFIA